MEQDTKTLLQETNYGCKMAVNSMKKIIEEAEDCELMKVILEAISKHEAVGDKTGKALKEHGHEEKEPSPMVTMYSEITTDLKLLWRDDTGKIAEIMVDGCNMGIKSISKVLNDCKNASGESRKLAEALIHEEDQFLRKLQPFL